MLGSSTPPANMLRHMRHGSAQPVRYTFALSEIRIHLSPSHGKAVSVDNVTLLWRTRTRKIEAKPAGVVERLHQVTGELSRTAELGVQEVLLPCTLYRHTSTTKWELPDDDGGSWDTKLSQLVVIDADEQVGLDEGVGTASMELCTAQLELTAHAGEASGPLVSKKRLRLPLSDDMGSLECVITSRRGSHSGENADAHDADAPESEQTFEGNGEGQHGYFRAASSGQVGRAACDFDQASANAEEVANLAKGSCE